LLALAPPAEAKVVYTPANVKLEGDKPFGLDLNHDSIVDFFLMHYNVFSSSSYYRQSLLACQSFEVIGGSRTFCPPWWHRPPSPSALGYNGIRMSDLGWGAALRYGAKIQRGDLFGMKNNIGLGLFNGHAWGGPWVNGGKGVRNRYLGIRFRINGRFHFGWARMTVVIGPPPDFVATLTGYAYETIAGKAIVAGKTKGPDVTTIPPASLGHLAAGASAIPSWRSGK
jgi:hypothetical protein